MDDPQPKWDLDLQPEKSDGSSPVSEFLDSLDRNYLNRVIKRLQRFQKTSLEVLQQTGDIGKVKNEDFYEIRLSVGIEVRLLGVIVIKDKPTFVAVHGFHKKDQSIKKRHLDITRDRIKAIS